MSHGAAVEAEERAVTPLELFFDLVFVFALTQVTTLLATEISWVNYLRGVAVLMAVWWAWAGFSWLTNARDAEDEGRRASLVATMAAMLVVGLAIPTSFGDDALVFTLAYALVVVLFLVTYAVSVRDDRDQLRAVGRLAAGSLPTPALMIVAALAGPGPLRTGAIVLALLIAYLSPYLAGTDGWSVTPSHFAERHGLIIIIALGESMVAMGLGASTEKITALTVVGIALGVLVIAAMWWLYFDVVSRAAERRLGELSGAERNALARDSYTMLHLPMVVGIVFVALGLKKALGDADGHLYPLVSLALFGGLALYLFAHVAFRWRNRRTLNAQRLGVGLLLLALVPVGAAVPALAAVALAAAVINGLVLFEVVHFRELRAAIRAGG